MPNLIDQSFFIRGLNIPNTGDAKILAKLNSYIQKYEKECLEKLLGLELYSVLLIETSERMTNLKSKLVNQETKESLIANYVYFKFQADTEPVMMEGGTSIGKTKAPSYVTPRDKMIYAWDEMSEIAYKLISFLRTNRAVYSEFTFQNYYNSLRIFAKIPKL